MRTSATGRRSGATAPFRPPRLRPGFVPMHKQVGIVLHVVWGQVSVLGHLVDVIERDLMVLGQRVGAFSCGDHGQDGMRERQLLQRDSQRSSRFGTWLMSQATSISTTVAASAPVVSSTPVRWAIRNPSPRLAATISATMVAASA